MYVIKIRNVRGAFFLHVHVACPISGSYHAYAETSLLFGSLNNFI